MENKDHIVIDEEATFTDPDEAVRFVEETGVDSLAINCRNCSWGIQG